MVGDTVLAADSHAISDARTRCWLSRCSSSRIREGMPLSPPFPDLQR